MENMYKWKELLKIKKRKSMRKMYKKYKNRMKTNKKMSKPYMKLQNKNYKILSCLFLWVFHQLLWLKTIAIVVFVCQYVCKYTPVNILKPINLYPTKAQHFLLNTLHYCRIMELIMNTYLLIIIPHQSQLHFTTR